tara:strand:+ start:757 stop:930 length:174 start_codon:yes stop_codon:yes gene_type:complete
MKTFKQFIEGLEDDFGAIGKARDDEAKDPIKGGGSIVNKKKGKKLLDRLLGPFTDKV